MGMGNFEGFFTGNYKGARCPQIVSRGAHDCKPRFRSEFGRKKILTDSRRLLSSNLIRELRLSQEECSFAYLGHAFIITLVPPIGPKSGMLSCFFFFFQPFIIKKKKKRIKTLGSPLSLRLDEPCKMPPSLAISPPKRD